MSQSNSSLPTFSHRPDPIGSGAENKRYPMLRLGLACNVSCPFCNVPWESYDYPAKLTLRQILEEVDKILASGSDRLNISGGEPTLRKELVEIVGYARSKGIKKVELQTNAILLSSMDYVSRLKKAGLTSAFVGLHSHIPKVHDFLVRSPGAFQKCLRGTQNLIQAQIDVILNPVITTVNFRTLPSFIKFIAETCQRKVNAVSLSVVQPHGRAWNNRPLLPRYGTISPYIQKALETADLLGLKVNNPYCGLPLCIGGWHKRLPNCVEYCEAELGQEPGEGQKIHPPACRRCKLRTHCGGVWKDYPLIHPLSDIRPLLPEKAKG